MNTYCPDSDEYPTAWYYRRTDWEWDHWEKPIGPDQPYSDKTYCLRTEGSGYEWDALPIVRSCIETEALPMSVAAGFLNDWIAEITRLANA